MQIQFLLGKEVVLYKHRQQRNDKKKKELRNKSIAFCYKNHSLCHPKRDEVQDFPVIGFLSISYK